MLVKIASKHAPTLEGLEEFKIVPGKIVRREQMNVGYFVRLAWSRISLFVVGHEKYKSDNRRDPSPICVRSIDYRLDRNTIRLAIWDRYSLA